MLKEHCFDRKYVIEPYGTICATLVTKGLKANFPPPVLLAVARDCTKACASDIMSATGAVDHLQLLLLQMLCKKNTIR